MRSDIADIVSGAVTAMDGCRRFLCFVRGREFQNETRKGLLQFYAALDRAKGYLASGCGDEIIATRLFGLQCLLMTHADELEMWLRLKRDEPHEAYTALVDAQSALAAAERCAPPCLGFPFAEYATRLRILEDLLFPPQRHLSAVIVSGPSRCTICGEFYDCCPHLVGEAYAGELCKCLCGSDPRIESCDFVESPDDKGARIVSIPSEGMQRDIMTWREIDGEGTHFRACILRTSQRNIPLDL